MATTVDEAKQAAKRAVGPGATDGLLERLAEQVGGKAKVDVVFGQPIDKGAVTVVPVARVRWGFGGGGGQSEAATETPAASGSGGGGGVAADPVGYLEIRETGATFVPIGGNMPSAGFLLASGLSAAFVIRALGRLLRRS